MKKTTLILMVLISAFAKGQGNPEDDIRKSLSVFFKAMQAADTATMRKLFYPGARLQTALTGNGNAKSRLLTETADSFLVKVARFHSDTLQFEERITSYDIRIDTPLASVWATYSLFVNGKLSHSGVDAFQLFQSENGWMIIQICDTRKKNKPVK